MSLTWAQTEGTGALRLVGRKEAQLRVLAYLETLSRMSFGLTATDGRVRGQHRDEWVYDWYAAGAETMREVMK